jgi:hypothetical protein
MMHRDAAQFAAVLDHLGREVLIQLQKVPRDALAYPLPFFEESLALLAMRFVQTGEFWVQEIVGGQHRPAEASFPVSSLELWSDLTGRYEHWLQTMHDILDDLPDWAMKLSIVLPANVRAELGHGTTTVRDCLLHVVTLHAYALGRIQTICQLLADGERAVEMVIQGHEMLSW